MDGKPQLEAVGDVRKSNFSTWKVSCSFERMLQKKLISAYRSAVLQVSCRSEIHPYTTAHNPHDGARISVGDNSVSSPNPGCAIADLPVSDLLSMYLRKFNALAQYVALLPPQFVIYLR